MRMAHLNGTQNVPLAHFAVKIRRSKRQNENHFVVYYKLCKKTSNAGQKDAAISRDIMPRIIVSGQPSNHNICHLSKRITNFLLIS